MGGSPPGGKNFLSPKFFKEKISKSYNGVKTPNMQKFLVSETMSSGGWGVPPPGGENFLSPKFLKEKISKSYNGVKPPNMQKFLVCETMSSGGGRGGSPPGGENFLSPKFLKTFIKSYKCFTYYFLDAIAAWI